MAGRWLRWWRALAAVLAARIAYAGLLHGPLVLTPLVYARFPTAMNSALNLPALVMVEALVSFLLVASFGTYFRAARPGVAAAALFGLWFGVLVYVPQNLLNGILLSPVRAPLVVTWILAGLGSGVVSALACRWLAPTTSRGREIG